MIAVTRFAADRNQLITSDGILSTPGDLSFFSIRIVFPTSSLSFVASTVSLFSILSSFSRYLHQCLPPDEAVASRAVFVIVSGSDMRMGRRADGWTGGNVFGAG